MHHKNKSNKNQLKTTSLIEERAMKLFKKISKGIVLSALGLSSLANAGLINGDFESGLTGWDASFLSSTRIVSNHEGYNAKQGGNFLRLTGNTAADKSHSVSQYIDLKVGDSLSGFAAYDWNDYSPFIDHASVEIYDEQGDLLTILWSETGEGLTSYANTPWTEFNFVATEKATYQLVLSAGNSQDNINAPYALFDDITANIPEPSTFAIFAFALIGFTCRRFKKRF